MKDIKTFLIGFLTCACMFLIMGQRSNNNLGNIKVRSISVINNLDQEILSLSQDDYGNGLIKAYNEFGVKSISLGAGKNGAGLIQVYNQLEIPTVLLGANKESDGTIALFDRYSELGWVQSGRQ